MTREEEKWKKIIKDTFVETVIEKIDSGVIFTYIKTLEKRIDKAIEFVEEFYSIPSEEDTHLLNKIDQEVLLEILRGKDENN